MLSLLRKRYNVLCSPAQIYVVISLVTVLAMLVQNMMEPHKYCVGNLSCDLNFSNLFLFAAKLVYIAVWTIILNSLCKTGYKNLSWLFVLLPLVLFMLLIVAFVTSNL